MTSSRARVRPTAAAVLLLFALAVPARGAAEVANCPLAGKRPPDDFLTQGSRPSLCKADLRGANLPAANLGGADLREANLGRANLPNVNLSAANLANAKGLTCDQIRAAHTDETTHLPATLKCAK